MLNQVDPRTLCTVKISLGGLNVGRVVLQGNVVEVDELQSKVMSQDVMIALR